MRQKEVMQRETRIPNSQGAPSGTTGKNSTAMQNQILEMMKMMDIDKLGASRD